MTTIACTPQVMATDSQAGSADGKCHLLKAWKLPGAVIGGAGIAAEVYRFYTWMLNGQRGEPPSLEGSVLLMIDGKHIWCFDQCPDPYPIDDKFSAVGTGSMAALAAMHLGCNPLEAVKTAIKVDQNSGGKVRVLEV